MRESDFEMVSTWSHILCAERHSRFPTSGSAEFAWAAM